MDAIQKFDTTRDNKFKTYAEFRVRGAILDELRAQDWVPRSIRGMRQTSPPLRQPRKGCRDEREQKRQEPNLTPGAKQMPNRSVGFGALRRISYQSAHRFDA